MAREMKDSGIEWIGEIPRSWGICRLRFLCNILTGNQDTQDNDPDGKYPFYVRSPIVEKSNSFTFEGDDILMAGDGVGAGKVFHYVSGKYGCHQRVYSLQKITGISRRFLYYYLQNRFYISIETANSKSTVDSVRLNMLQDFSVTIPNCEEQQSIAVFLDTQCAHIDSVIEKTRAAIEEYKKLKQAVITQAVTKGIRPNREMKDSGLNVISSLPRDWKVNPIKHICEIPITDGTHMTPDYSDENNGSPFISSKDVTSGQINWTKIKYITKELHNELKKSIAPRRNDILLAKNGTTGVAALVDDDREFDVYVTIAVIRVKSQIIIPKFALYSINSQLCKRQFDEHLKGIGVPNLHLGTINNTKIFIPAISEQTEIVAYLDEKTASIDSLIQKKEQLITELEAYKKSLIYEYVTGKKEVVL